MKPVALILRTAGTNCDIELAHAFELAGANTRTLHINHLIEDSSPLKECSLIGLPGGFSYGDDIAAGTIFAHKLRYKLLKPLLNAVRRNVPIIAPCNGFQVLIKLGLLPGKAGAKQNTINSDDYVQTASLAQNSNGRFIDKWVQCEAPQDSHCIWTKGLQEFDLPIAHGEGRFVADKTEIGNLKKSNQIALRYNNENPNGSIDNIAGVCDSTGLIFGLMPHPERYLDITNRPDWTSMKGENTDKNITPGLQIFKNAVEYVGN